MLTIVSHNNNNNNNSNNNKYYCYKVVNAWSLSGIEYNASWFKPRDHGRMKEICDCWHIFNQHVIKITTSNIHQYIKLITALEY